MNTNVFPEPRSTLKAAAFRTCVLVLLALKIGAAAAAQAPSSSDATRPPARSPFAAVNLNSSPSAPAVVQAPTAGAVDALLGELRAFIMRWRSRFIYFIPAALMVLIVLYMALWGRPAFFSRGILAAPLVLLAILSLWHYAGFYPWINKTYFNEYEFYHYYIGSKYAPEVGYGGMYDASIVADDETGKVFTSKSIRNLNYMHGSIDERKARADKPYYDVKEVLARKDEIKGRFNPDRWAEFVKDIQFFRRTLGTPRWSKIMHDKGYNATPVWGLAGGLLSNAVSTDNKPGLLALALLDPLLIGMALLCVAWAYGLRTALFLGAFFGVNYLTMHSPTMKMAYLRTDWIALTLMGASLVRKGWYKSAGALMAYAGLARIFPAIFAFGIGARAAVELVHTRRFPWKHAQFFVVYALAASALVGLSIAYAGGLHQWREFFDKIGYHNDDISPWRVGFRYIFFGTFEQPPRGMGWWDFKAQLQTFYQTHAAIWWTIQGAVLLLCALAIRHLRDDEAIPFSFVPVFFLVAPTHYYYMMLVIPVLFLAMKVDSPLRGVGFIYLLGVGMVGYSYNSRGWQFPHAFDMSSALLVFVLYLLLIPGVEGRLGLSDAASSRPPLLRAWLRNAISRRKPVPDSLPAPQ